jgi:hypothetical protein
MRKAGHDGDETYGAAGLSWMSGVVTACHGLPRVVFATLPDHAKGRPSLSVVGRDSPGVLADSCPGLTGFVLRQIANDNLNWQGAPVNPG